MVISTISGISAGYGDLHGVTFLLYLAPLISIVGFIWAITKIAKVIQSTNKRVLFAVVLFILSFIVFNVSWALALGEYYGQ